MTTASEASTAIQSRLAPAAAAGPDAAPLPVRIPVVITVDTEPDDAWTDHRNESVRNIYELNSFQTLLNEFGAKATYLTTYRVAADDRARDLLKRYEVEHGAEIGAHLHPWETPPFLDSGIDTRFATFPHELSLDDFEAKLGELTRFLEARFGRVTSYRAGRWGLAAEHLPILERAGYRVDTSVIPWIDWRGTFGLPREHGGKGGADYRRASDRPYFPDYQDVCRAGGASILEVPVTVGFTRAVNESVWRDYGVRGSISKVLLRKIEVFRPVWATPAEERADHLDRMLAAFRSQPRAHFNLTIHSSELCLGTSPSTRTPEMTQGVFTRIRAMLSAIAADSRFEFATLSDAALRWTTPRSKEAPTMTVSTTDFHATQSQAAATSTIPKGRPKRVRLAYILAASHSGSTLTAMLLGAHPDVITSGELKATNLGDKERYHCSCRRLIKQCPFWISVAQAMARRGFDFDITSAHTDYREVESAYARRLLRPLHRGPLLESLRDFGLGLSPTWRREHARAQNRNAALAQSVLEVSGRSLIVDSSKIALRLKYLLRNPDIDVRVVRTVRDGRGVALTYMDPFEYADASDPSQRGGGTGAAHPGRFMSAADAAYRWRRSNLEAEALLSALPPAQVVRIRYEELCADPLGTVRKVFAFLGVDPNKATLNFREREQHVVGNGMRMDTVSEIRLDERWRSVLTPQELADFDRVAGDMNRSYGYR